MARFNEILVGRYNRLTQKLFSMKGPAALPAVNEELHLVLPLYHGAENRYLEGWDQFALRVQTAAGGAGLFGKVRFRNPPGSNLLAAITKITVAAVVAADFPLVQIFPVTTDLGSAVTNTQTGLDARGRPNPSLITTSETTAGAFAPINWQGAVALNAVVDVILDEALSMPLLPGSALTVQSNVANQVFTVSVWWRERFLEDSERA